MNSGLRKFEISVIVPAYNAQATIAETLASLAAQTFGDFECVVVDDGSTDETATIAEDFARRDGRFRVLRKDRGGVSSARNAALSCTTGRYVAFLDADDIAYPHRLAKQKRFLDRHANIAFVGSGAEVFGLGVSPGASLVFLEDHDEILPMLTFTLEFLMSSIMMRREVVQAVGAFDPSFHVSEDWEFLARAARRFRCANLDEPLVRYRRSHTQATRALVDSPTGPSIMVRSQHLSWLGIPPPEQDLEAHIAISPSHWPIERDIPEEAYSKDRIYRWVCCMIKANWRTRRFNTRIFAKMLNHLLNESHEPAFPF